MTVHEYSQGRESLGRSPISNATYYGTTARCSCGWKYRTNETPSGTGGRYAREAHATHVDEVAGPIIKVGRGWEWKPPGEPTRRYHTKRDAVAARDEGPDK